jgi:hypothetical protein
MELYTAIKENEILSFAGKWMELEEIILSEGSQVHKTEDHIFSHMWNTNINISHIMKTGHAKGTSHMREMVKEGG